MAYALDGQVLSCLCTDDTANQTIMKRRTIRRSGEDYSRGNGCIPSRHKIPIFLLFTTSALLGPLQTNALVPRSFPLIRKAKPTRAQAVSTTPQSSESSQFQTSKRVKFLNKIGFKNLSSEGNEVRKSAQKGDKYSQRYHVTSVAELESYFDDTAGRFRDDKGDIDYDSLLKSLSVKGDTQIIGSPDHPEYVHPVAKLLHERKLNNSTCTEGPRPDGFKVALAIEGGGMRGCVSAGMICALHHLGLRDTIDVVYGSSAGSIIGAYFITEQLPWFGPELYYDKLTTAGKEFIDTKRLLRALGFGLADPRLLKDVLTRRDGEKPVLNLPFLLRKTLQETKPLDWEFFVERQKKQPLKVVASALRSEQKIVMDMEGKHFESFDDLSNCMHGSCLLPGIAGPLMNIKKSSMGSNKPKFVVGNNIEDPDYEPIADALVYAPIPYEAAIEDGATHVVVIRSRPDGTDVTGKGGLFERLIFRRFFLRKNKLPGMYKRMTHQLHKKLYGKNVLETNEEAYSERSYKDTSRPHMLTVALSPGSEEVTRLETGREAIFNGVRRGFARAYDALVEDPSERGRGEIVAREYFPDEIMDYDPTEIDRVDASAFSIFKEANGI